MRKTAILILLLISLTGSGAIAADWHKVAESFNNDIWYLDLDSIKNKDGSMFFDNKIISKDGTYSRAIYSINCSEKSYKPVRVKVYKDGKLAKNLTFTDIFPYYGINHNSAFEKIYYIVCDK